MTRVSPVGTVAVQCTSPLPAGVVAGLVDVLADALGDAAALALAEGLAEAAACSEVVGVAWLDEFDPPQAVTSNRAATNEPMRTR
jgi:hypothetical protein